MGIEEARARALLVRGYLYWLVIFYSFFWVGWWQWDIPSFIRLFSDLGHRSLWALDHRLHIHSASLPGKLRVMKMKSTFFQESNDSLICARGLFMKPVKVFSMCPLYSCVGGVAWVGEWVLTTYFQLIYALFWFFRTLTICPNDTKETYSLGRWPNPSILYWLDFESFPNTLERVRALFFF